MLKTGLEIEVKVPVEDPERCAERLLRRGARETAPRRFELNLLFDATDRWLSRTGKLLRLRRLGDEVFLTYKAKPGEEISVDPAFKTRVERECRLVESVSFDVMREILTGIGFVPVYRYEKYRRKFRLDEVALDLDETPIGCYLELEGDEESIKVVAEKLGFAIDTFLPKSYRALQSEWCRERGMEPGDMVFPEKDSA